MDWLARVGLIAAAVFLTAQYGFRAEWAWLRSAYLVAAAALAIWTIFNSLGKKFSDAMLEATLPMIFGLACLYSQAQLPH